MVKLYSLQDSLQFKEYMDVLKEEHISCYSKESESGEYLKIPAEQIFISMMKIKRRQKLY